MGAVVVSVYADVKLCTARVKIYQALLRLKAISLGTRLGNVHACGKEHKLYRSSGFLVVDNIRHTVVGYIMGHTSTQMSFGGTTFFYMS